MQVGKLPTEIQWIILKYLSYSPTSQCIHAHPLVFVRARELYDHLDIRFDIFKTNDGIVVERIFNPVTLRYIQIIKRWPSLAVRDIYYKESKFYKKRLINLNRARFKTEFPTT